MRSQPIFAFAVAVTTSVFFCSQAAHARSSSNASTANAPSAIAAAKREAARMVPATAVLTQKIDARKIQPGQQFHARLTETVHLKDGATLPKGTNLVGTIAQDTMKPDGTSTLALRFTTADMRNGKAVPIVATIVGVSPPSNGEESDWSYASAPPDPWNGRFLIIDQIGAVSGFDLHSNIAGPDSGVFVSKKKDEVKLADQTQLSLAIAGRSAGAKNGGA